MAEPRRGGRALAWPAPWASLARAAGGVDALAARLETDRRVVSRWAAGREPQGPARVAIRMVAAQLGVTSPV